MLKDEKTIMIVEDDSYIMDIYKTKLLKEGFKIITANDGVQALKKLEEEKAQPDLILLDIMMPHLDGLSVLKKLQVNERWKFIPVILLTNLGQKEKIQKGFKLGAKDYLIKAYFTPAEVVEKINQYL
ncbi:MAG TPA: response regulator [Candidatus Moranbacteria bacterium]|nr:response regulator [Candidatus Moranbacteria bacterium]